MLKFKVRKSGGDLHLIPAYSSGDLVKGNPYHPEFAPKSVGGTMSELKNKNALGNCTFYAFGRLIEVFGIRLPKPLLRQNARNWGNGDGALVSKTPQVGGIVVFDENYLPVAERYGHVAFIEHIDAQGNIHVSESCYSEKTNGWLFRYGRTVKQVCQEWNMSVLRYIAPLQPCESYFDDPISDRVAQNGKFTVTEEKGVNIRTSPSTSGNRVSGLAKGESVIYDSYIDAEGYRWVSWLREGVRVYAARRKLDNSEIFGDAEFVDAPKPTLNQHGQAVSVGQRIRFSALYKSDNSGSPTFASNCYYQEKWSGKTVGWGYVLDITPNGYKVSSQPNGSVIGFVRYVNVY